jgi:hypothetical protein
VQMLNLLLNKLKLNASRKRKKKGKL